SSQGVNWKEKKQFEVYLPQGAGWYDFATGKKVPSGVHHAEVNISQMPIYVKEGTILPLCQKTVDHANVTDWAELDINVYPGANAEFTLYEDEGDNLNYTRGAYSTIFFRWNDKKRQLTIMPRQGQFDGMVARRTFHVKVIGGKTYDVVYNGKKVVVK
ncbi:MAG: DUF5110 domain-containing protein, partial [Bacteroidaceae bacterium]|nr:DUF5110 domain-containing protein [Bacteroidaceae bacterium]